ncbi:hypothetical protein CRENBAI_006003, partial [Crenichthys baileyi]
KVNHESGLTKRVICFRTHPLCMLFLGGSAADLHGLATGPSGLCTDRLGSRGFHTAPLRSTVGSPGPTAGRQISSHCTACLGSSGFRTAPLSSTVGSPGPATGRLFVFSYVAGLLIAGSARDCLRAGRLNSCPPSKAPSAHPGRVVLFLVIALLPRPPPPTVSLSPKSWSILCRSEAEPKARSLETYLFCCSGIFLRK